jgi:type I restriction enzyme S subunit
MFDQTKVVNEFGLLILRSNNFLDQLFTMPSGTKQGNLSNEQILSISISFPTEVNDQINIINRTQIETSWIDRIISKIQNELVLVQEYKTALISEVVTGKIKVIA